MPGAKCRAPVFLITAGPTIEDLDPVRFISNRATGKLGLALARAALDAGGQVIFIHGPLPEKVRQAIPVSSRLVRVPVRSAADMRQAVMRRVPAANVVIMNAAVADYTPARPAAVKLKKSGRALLLRLKPTVDILAQLGELKRRRHNLVLVGFALETGPSAPARRREQARWAQARRKLRAKNLDAIVLDAPAAIGADGGAFTVFRRDGAGRTFPAISKARLARAVVGLSAACWARGQRRG